jgi:hypothetical protein
MAVTHEQASTSVEFVRFLVGATEDGDDVDLTPNAVAVGFLLEGSDSPAAADILWESATWETDNVTVPGQPKYYAKVLVGPAPGEVQLSAGIWQPWVKVSDAPEVVIRKAAGELRIV